MIILMLYDVFFSLFQRDMDVFPNTDTYPQDYQELKFIGNGRFGRVYKVQNRRTGIMYKVQNRRTGIMYNVGDTGYI